MRTEFRDPVPGKRLSTYLFPLEEATFCSSRKRTSLLAWWLGGERSSEMVLEGTGAGGKEQTNHREVSKRVNRFASSHNLKICLSGRESMGTYM